jgi:hypothetical protein
MGLNFSFHCVGALVSFCYCNTLKGNSITRNAKQNNATSIYRWRSDSVSNGVRSISFSNTRWIQSFNDVAFYTRPWNEPVTKKSIVIFNEAHALDRGSTSWLNSLSEHASVTARSVSAIKFILLLTLPYHNPEEHFWIHPNLLYNTISGAFCPGVKFPNREADHSPQSSVTNVGSFIPRPLYVFLA